MAGSDLLFRHCSYLLFVLALLPLATSKSNVHVITTENFDEVLKGEWMLEFYAPWCPACKQFTDTWETFADWAADDVGRGLKVGKVDVTVETMLSGQFMVTHLPTIVHVKDAQVRAYYKERHLEALQEFVEEEQWKEEEPVPWWRSPTATHMKGIGIIFWLSEKAKELQVVLEEKYELPTYAVFVIIALVTIVVGLSLGGLTVFCIEVCLRVFSKPRPPVSMATKKPKETPNKQRDDKSTQGEAESSSTPSSRDEKKDDHSGHGGHGGHGGGGGTRKRK